MTLQRPGLFLALKNRAKYLKIYKVAQNFSIFRNFQENMKKMLLKNDHFYNFVANFSVFFLILESQQ